MSVAVASRDGERARHFAAAGVALIAREDWIDDLSAPCYPRVTGPQQEIMPVGNRRGLEDLILPSRRLGLRRLPR